MKARHFRKLRKLCQWYNVRTTTSLFGLFNFTRGIEVLARNHREACIRAKRRGYGLNHSIGHGTTETWAKWKVRLSDKPDHYRNVKYF